MKTNRVSKRPLFQWRISQRFIFYVLLFSSLVTLILTAVQLYLDYRRGIISIKSSIDQIEVSYLKGIINSMWLSDGDLLQIQLEGMLKLNDMAYIEISQNGQTLVSVGNLSESRQISKEFPLTYTYEQKTISLGTLHVVYTLQNLYASLLNRVLIIAISQSIKTFLVSSFIFFIFYMLVARHLTTLAHYMKTLNLSSLNTPFDLRDKKDGNEQDEFNIVTKAINEMRANLNESYLQLQEEIKERVSMEEMLKEHSAFNETMLSMSPDIIYIYDLVKKENVYSNEGIMKVLGYSIEEIKNMKDTLIQSLMHPDDFSSYLNRTVPLYSTANDNELIEHEFRMRHKKGNWCWLYSRELIFSRLEDGNPLRIFGLITDITERKQADKKIADSIIEKETLLHEIHHRVKNNMQVINSLLQLQANSIEDPRIKNILKESQNRVYAMSAVHETLHGSEKLSDIDLLDYLVNIATSVFQTYLIDHQNLNLITDIENSPINISQAYPLGLIVNELVSNCLKHAFPDNTAGVVSVSLKKCDKGFELIVADDGVGFSSQLDWRKTDSLGLKLVRTLVENQLDGTIEMQSVNGTRFIITFNMRS